MRIGIDARFYSSAFTGIGCYVKELIQNLAELDTRNEYVLFLRDPFFESFEVPNARFKKVRADIRHYTFEEQWRFFLMLKAEKLDLMHFTHFNAPILYRGPSVVTIHDLTLNFFPGKKMGSAFNQFIYKRIINSITHRAKKIISVSEHTKKDLIKILHADPNKIRVIHNGVSQRFHRITNAQLLGKFCAQYGLTKPYILYTGVWRSHKNLVNLIKAFSILKHKFNFPGWLVISGKEDPWYPEVQKTVHDEKLSGDVRFTGYVPDDDLVLLYNNAKTYVLPSFYEGFGLPALEAFACGIPVCATKTSAVPEVCGKDNATFFDPHSPLDMAEKIASLLADEKKQKQLIERGLTRVKDFSWQKMARETLDIYNSSN